MLAVIKTGGKQYLVSPGQKIKIEKISASAPLRGASSFAPLRGASEDKSAGNESKESKEIVFNQVLLLEKNKKLEIGTPFVKGAKVIGKILSQGKGEKVIAFKYKSKTRRKTKKGHRQPFTEVEILKIETH